MSGPSPSVSAIRSLRATSVLLAIAVAASVLLAATSAEAQDAPGAAGSSGWAGFPGAPILAQRPAGSLAGLDVSHWQETIDWPQVAAAGYSFAIAKATEGRTYVDPMYATNKADATASGLRFTAYHFARPDADPNDAILEADHFVDVAQLGPGNLIPVLDLERTGGLSETELTEWILDWLDRVTERLGVRPMVYTSPYGWASRTGDTTAVAEAGYTILWVAHWGVSSPTVPADDWSGNGWTFWQYTDCGSVPGIQGCVDLDWYATTDLQPVMIPSPDATPPTASLEAPSGVAGPLSISFDEVVRQVTPDNVRLWTAESSTYEQVTLSCRSGKGTIVDCRDGNIRTALVQPTSPLVPGQTYQAALNPPGAIPVIVDRSGNPAPTTEVAFDTPTEIEQGSPAVGYGWRTVSNAKAFGRSFTVDHLAGSSVSFAFSGREVTWYTATGRAQGKAAVSIDGRRVGTFDQYSSSPRYRVARRFTGLARGTHTITVRVLGKGDPRATGTQVVVDAFAVRQDLVKSPQVSASWSTRRSARASGGSVSVSDVARSSVTFRFRGTGVQWATVKGPQHGRAAVYVDGTLVRTVDNYAREQTFGVVRSISGLAAGVHTVRIVALGEGRPKADGTLIAVDRFVVLG
jgi:GH25 family lysozyme M1 (1,4-beta-N-acetylmuramidase)